MQRTYLFQEEIGNGSTSVVYHALDEKTFLNVAIKKIPKEYFEKNQDELKRFQEEVSLLRRFSSSPHPHLLSLLDMYEDDKYYFLVTDFCREGDLFNYIVKNGAIKEQLASHILHQILQGLNLCHQNNVVHRDMKLENIFITNFPNVIIGDFGLAEEVNPNELLQSYCGSTIYSAPELLRKEPYNGFKSDIYSVGVILFCMVTGNFPWNPDNPMKMIHNITNGNFNIPPSLSPKCRSLISQMMNIDPDQRPNISQILNHPFLLQQNTQCLPYLYSPIPHIHSDKKVNFSHAFLPNHKIESEKSYNHLNVHPPRRVINPVLCHNNPRNVGLSLRSNKSYTYLHP